MDKRSFLLLVLFTITIFAVHHWFSKDTNSAAPATQIVSTPTPPSIEAADKPPQGEKFYVLENDYQQVVFSNVGGAVAEINLPFKTADNQKSVVLPIGFDHILKDTYPQNAYFPSREYFTPTSKQTLQPHLGGYMPLLRRSLAEAPYRSAIQISPVYYAFNVVSMLSDDHDTLAEAIYTLKSFDNERIVFELVQNNRKITKTYRFAKNPSDVVPYSLILELQIEGDARGLGLTSGVPEVEMISGSSASSIKYRYDRNHKTIVDQAKLPKQSNMMKGISPEWVSNANSFFGVIINPIIEKPAGFETSLIPGSQDPTRITVIDAAYNLYPEKKYPGYLVTLPLKPTSKLMTLRIFAGPFDQTILKRVDDAFRDPKTLASPYLMGAQASTGGFSFISEPFSKFLYTLMKFFYTFTHSWVAAIVLLTIALKIILYPLNNWSLRSMTRMQMLAPEVKAIDARFAKDPKRANLEKMQLYRDKKANPFSGCLPMIIQMPFLIGMFDLLKSAFPLRGVAFIPGWIDNLIAPDTLFSWSYPIFFIGTDFHLLPIILGGLMFLQQKCSNWMNTSKVVDPEAKKQAAMTGNITTIVFTILFYNFPAGLNIYWISSTALGILQQIAVASKLNAANVKSMNKISTK